MSSVNMDIINKVFEPYSDRKIFCATKEHNKESTKENKAPYDPRKKTYMEWAIEENRLTLDELNRFIPEKYPGCGFVTGVTTNDCNGIPYPSIQCFDFDDVLENGEPKHPKLDDFLDRLNTYVEISAGGNGLHAVVLSNFTGQEWGFDDKNWWKGKYYPKNHFIKLTGNIYKNFNREICYFESAHIQIARSRIGIIVKIPENKPSVQSNFSGPFKSWYKILKENGIPFEETNYSDKIRVYKDENGVITGEKLCVESWKIECPNKDKHTFIPNPDKSAHKAIICRWEDGTSSLKCNHDACKPENKPNLLQMLWNQLRYKEKYQKLKDAGMII